MHETVLCEICIPKKMTQLKKIPQLESKNIKLEEKLHDWKTNWKMQKKLAQICTEV